MAIFKVRGSIYSGRPPLAKQPRIETDKIIGIIRKFKEVFSPQLATPNGLLISAANLTADASEGIGERPLSKILQKLNLQGIEELAGWIKNKSIVVIRENAPEIIKYLKDWQNSQSTAIYAASPNHIMETTGGKFYAFVKYRLSQAGFWF